MDGRQSTSLTRRRVASSNESTSYQRDSLLLLPCEPLLRIAFTSERTRWQAAARRNDARHVRDISRSKKRAQMHFRAFPAWRRCLSPVSRRLATQGARRLVLDRNEEIRYDVPDAGCETAAAVATRVLALSLTCTFLRPAPLKYHISFTNALSRVPKDLDLRFEFGSRTFFPIPGFPTLRQRYVGSIRVVIFMSSSCSLYPCFRNFSKDSRIALRLCRFEFNLEAKCLSA